MDSFTFSLRFCLRGGKFLGGYIIYALFVGLRDVGLAGDMHQKALWAGREMVKARDKRTNSSGSSVQQKAPVKAVSFAADW
jgi:hypothetical protein